MLLYALEGEIYFTTESLQGMIEKETQKQVKCALTSILGICNSL